ncbi:pyrimidine reductase family protein [Actinopolymorpha cephalotaxi]|uniref:Riboflavin biosynthesis pyrimidine reductase n=1 Tax=Actinopolymorpha cephalotaxi TaxID=504797 RepID=A0ABX2S1N5_9ACTN|nr:pyrimidine reductase family protein [Actinopolymorpha cephalotaxi]NYH83528.1 riboflavin biosynthesis pyrimidine reductase [Actinopolymorpha cephalotaxi]
MRGTAARPLASAVVRRSGGIDRVRILTTGPAASARETADLTDAELAEIYRYPADLADRAWLRVNFVSSVDGAAQGPDGRSGTISGRPDRHVLALLRALCDVILVGAGTARTERYGPATIRPAFVALREQLGLAPTPPIAVVSHSLDVPDRLLADPRTIVITSRSCSPERRTALESRVDVAIAGESEVDVAEAVAALAQRGYRRILSEGGPNLFAKLLAGSLVDEVCLTQSPELLAGPAMRITHGPLLAEPTRLTLASLLEEDGFVFQRWLTGSHRETPG